MTTDTAYADHIGLPEDRSADAGRPGRELTGPSAQAQAREEILRFRSRRPWRAIGATAVESVLYAGCAVAVVLAPAAVKPFVSIGLALVAGRMFVIAHDACHGSLFSSRLANRIVGRALFLTSYTPYSLWDLGHNRIHHAFTNLKGRDYVWAPMSRSDYRHAPAWRQRLERLYRNPVGHGLYYFLEIYWKRLLFPSRRYVPEPRPAYRWDSVAVTLFALAQVGALAVAARLTGQSAVVLIAAGVVAPFGLFNLLMGSAIFLHHTHPLVTWFDDVHEWSAAEPQLRGSVHVVFPLGLGALLHNIMDHTAHHIDPLIPLFHVPDAQRAIERHFEAPIFGTPILKPKVQTWTLKFFLDAVRTCKLYDYDAHRWLDFDGRTTSQVPQVRSIRW